MPALKNPQHEKFAHALLKNPTITKAYQEVYDSDYEVANAGSSRLLRKDSVKSRFIELVEENEQLNDNGLNLHLTDLIQHGKDGVRLGVAQTILKVKGILADGTNQAQSNNVATVVFNDVTVNVT